MSQLEPDQPVPLQPEDDTTLPQSSISEQPTGPQQILPEQPEPAPQALIFQQPAPQQPMVQQLPFEQPKFKLPGLPSRPDWRPVLEKWMKQGQEITAQWLYEVGGWIFGGLIAAALMLLQNLISFSFEDRALVVAGFAVALALPVNLTGLWIVRYVRDINQALNTEKQFLVQNGATDEETVSTLSTEDEAFLLAKRQRIATIISAVLALSVFFTLIGFGSALWHISWVATILFVLAIAAGLATISRVLN